MSATSPGLPPDLRDALETVRSSIASPFRDGWREALDQLVLIEQRLVEYERVAEAARYSVTPVDGWKALEAQQRLETALATLDSPKEKP